MLVLPPLCRPMVNIIVGKYVFVIFLSLYVIRSSRGTCLSTKMLKGYMARVSVGNPVVEHFHQKIAQHATVIAGITLHLLI